jgi:hypothetical protein
MFLFDFPQFSVRIVRIAAQFHRKAEASPNAI